MEKAGLYDQIPKMNKTIYLGRLSIGFGWYSGDPFYLFKLILLEMDNSLYHDWTTLFELQIIRFAISIILEE